MASVDATGTLSGSSQAGQVLLGFSKFLNEAQKDNQDSALQMEALGLCINYGLDIEEACWLVDTRDRFNKGQRAGGLNESETDKTTFKKLLEDLKQLRGPLAKKAEEIDRKMDKAEHYQEQRQVLLRNFTRELQTKKSQSQITPDENKLLAEITEKFALSSLTQQDLILKVLKSPLFLVFEDKYIAESHNQEYAAVCQKVRPAREAFERLAEKQARRMFTIEPSESAPADVKEILKSVNIFIKENRLREAVRLLIVNNRLLKPQVLDFDGKVTSLGRLALSFDLQLEIKQTQGSPFGTDPAKYAAVRGILKQYSDFLGDYKDKVFPLAPWDSFVKYIEYQALEAEGKRKEAHDFLVKDRTSFEVSEHTETVGGKKITIKIDPKLTEKFKIEKNDQGLTITLKSVAKKVIEEAEAALADPRLTPTADEEEALVRGFNWMRMPASFFGEENMDEVIKSSAGRFTLVFSKEAPLSPLDARMRFEKDRTILPAGMDAIKIKEYQELLQRTPNQMGMPYLDPNKPADGILDKLTAVALANFFTANGADIQKAYEAKHAQKASSTSAPPPSGQPGATPPDKLPVVAGPVTTNLFGGQTKGPLGMLSNALNTPTNTISLAGASRPLTNTIAATGQTALAPVQTPGVSSKTAGPAVPTPGAPAAAAKPPDLTPAQIDLAMSEYLKFGLEKGTLLIPVNDTVLEVLKSKATLQWNMRPRGPAEPSTTLHGFETARENKVAYFRQLLRQNQIWLPSDSPQSGSFPDRLTDQDLLRLADILETVVITYNVNTNEEVQKELILAMAGLKPAQTALKSSLEKIKAATPEKPAQLIQSEFKALFEFAKTCKLPHLKEALKWIIETKGDLLNFSISSEQAKKIRDFANDPKNKDKWFDLKYLQAKLPFLAANIERCTNVQDDRKDWFIVVPQKVGTMFSAPLESQLILFEKSKMKEVHDLQTNISAAKKQLGVLIANGRSIEKEIKDFVKKNPTLHDFFEAFPEKSPWSGLEKKPEKDQVINQAERAALEEWLKANPAVAKDWAVLLEKQAANKKAIADSVRELSLMENQKTSLLAQKKGLTPDELEKELADADDPWWSFLLLGPLARQMNQMAYIHRDRDENGQPIAGSSPERITIGGAQAILRKDSAERQLLDNNLPGWRLLDLNPEADTEIRAQQEQFNKLKKPDQILVMNALRKYKEAAAMLTTIEVDPVTGQKNKNLARIGNRNYQWSTYLWGITGAPVATVDEQLVPMARGQLYRGLLVGDYLSAEERAGFLDYLKDFYDGKGTPEFNNWDLKSFASFLKTFSETPPGNDENSQRLVAEAKQLLADIETREKAKPGSAAKDNSIKKRLFIFLTASREISVGETEKKSSRGGLSRFFGYYGGAGAQAVGGTLGPFAYDGLTSAWSSPGDFAGSYGANLAANYWNLRIQMPLYMRFGWMADVSKNIYHGLAGDITGRQAWDSLGKTALQFLVYPNFAPIWYLPVLEKFDKDSPNYDPVGGLALYYSLNMIAAPIWRRTLGVIDGSLPMRLGGYLPYVGSRLRESEGYSRYSQTGAWGWADNRYGITDRFESLPDGQRKAIEYGYAFARFIGFDPIGTAFRTGRQVLNDHIEKNQDQPPTWQDPLLNSWFPGGKVALSPVEYAFDYASRQGWLPFGRPADADAGFGRMTREDEAFVVNSTPVAKDRLQQFRQSGGNFFLDTGGIQASVRLSTDGPLTTGIGNARQSAELAGAVTRAGIRTVPVALVRIPVQCDDGSTVIIGHPQPELSRVLPVRFIQIVRAPVPTIDTIEVKEKPKPDDKTPAADQPAQEIGGMKWKTKDGILVPEHHGDNSLAPEKKDEKPYTITKKTVPQPVQVVVTPGDGIFGPQVDLYIYAPDGIVDEALLQSLASGQYQPLLPVSAGINNQIPNYSAENTACDTRKTAADGATRKMLDELGRLTPDQLAGRVDLPTNLQTDERARLFLELQNLPGGGPTLYDTQVTALRLLARNADVFVNVDTGQGKTLVTTMAALEGALGIQENGQTGGQRLPQYICCTNIDSLNQFVNIDENPALRLAAAKTPVFFVDRQHRFIQLSVNSEGQLIKTILPRATGQETAYRAVANGGLIILTYQEYAMHLSFAMENDLKTIRPGVMHGEEIDYALVQTASTNFRVASGGGNQFEINPLFTISENREQKREWEKIKEVYRQFREMFVDGEGNIIEGREAEAVKFLEEKLGPSVFKGGFSSQAVIEDLLKAARIERAYCVTDEVLEILELAGSDNETVRREALRRAQEINEIADLAARDPKAAAERAARAKSPTADHRIIIPPEVMALIRNASLTGTPEVVLGNRAACLQKAGNLRDFRDDVFNEHKLSRSRETGNLVHLDAENQPQYNMEFGGLLDNALKIIKHQRTKPLSTTMADIGIRQMLEFNLFRKGSSGSLEASSDIVRSCYTLNNGVPEIYKIPPFLPEFELTSNRNGTGIVYRNRATGQELPLNQRATLVAALIGARDKFAHQPRVKACGKLIIDVPEALKMQVAAELRLLDDAIATAWAAAPATAGQPDKTPLSVILQPPLNYYSNPELEFSHAAQTAVRNSSRGLLHIVSANTRDEVRAVLDRVRQQVTVNGTNPGAWTSGSLVGSDGRARTIQADFTAQINGQNIEIFIYTEDQDSERLEEIKNRAKEGRAIIISNRLYRAIDIDLSGNFNLPLTEAGAAAIPLTGSPLTCIRMEGAGLTFVGGELSKALGVQAGGRVGRKFWGAVRQFSINENNPIIRRYVESVLSQENPNGVNITGKVPEMKDGKPTGKTVDGRITTRAQFFAYLESLARDNGGVLEIADNSPIADVLDKCYEMATNDQIMGIRRNHQMSAINAEARRPVTSFINDVRLGRICMREAASFAVDGLLEEAGFGKEGPPRIRITPENRARLEAGVCALLGLPENSDEVSLRGLEGQEVDRTRLQEVLAEKIYQRYVESVPGKEFNWRTLMTAFRVYRIAGEHFSVTQRAAEERSGRMAPDMPADLARRELGAIWGNAKVNIALDLFRNVIFPRNRGTGRIRQGFEWLARVTSLPEVRVTANEMTTDPAQRNLGSLRQLIMERLNAAARQPEGAERSRLIQEAVAVVTQHDNSDPTQLLRERRELARFAGTCAEDSGVVQEFETRLRANEIELAAPQLMKKDQAATPPVAQPPQPPAKRPVVRPVPPPSGRPADVTGTGGAAPVPPPSDPSARPAPPVPPPSGRPADATGSGGAAPVPPPSDPSARPAPPAPPPGGPIDVTGTGGAASEDTLLPAGTVSPEVLARIQARKAAAGTSPSAPLPAAAEPRIVRVGEKEFKLTLFPEAPEAATKPEKKDDQNPPVPPNAGALVGDVLSGRMIGNISLVGAAPAAAQNTVIQATIETLKDRGLLPEKVAGMLTSGDLEFKVVSSADWETAVNNTSGEPGEAETVTAAKKRAAAGSDIAYVQNEDGTYQILIRENLFNQTNWQKVIRFLAVQFPRIFTHPDEAKVARFAHEFSEVDLKSRRQSVIDGVEQAALGPVVPAPGAKPEAAVYGTLSDQAIHEIGVQIQALARSLQIYEGLTPIVATSDGRMARVMEAEGGATYEFLPESLPKDLKIRNGRIIGTLNTEVGLYQRGDNYFELYEDGRLQEYSPKTGLWRDVTPVSTQAKNFGKVMAGQTAMYAIVGTTLDFIKRKFNGEPIDAITIVDDAKNRVMGVTVFSAQSKAVEVLGKLGKNGWITAKQLQNKALGGHAGTFVFAYGSAKTWQDSGDALGGTGNIAVFESVMKGVPKGLEHAPVPRIFKGTTFRGAIGLALALLAAEYTEEGLKDLAHRWESLGESAMAAGILDVAKASTDYNPASLLARKISDNGVIQNSLDYVGTAAEWRLLKFFVEKSGGKMPLVRQVIAPALVAAQGWEGGCRADGSILSGEWDLAKRMGSGYAIMGTTWATAEGASILAAGGSLLTGESAVAIFGAGAKAGPWGLIIAGVAFDAALAYQIGAEYNRVWDIVENMDLLEKNNNKTSGFKRAQRGWITGGIIDSRYSPTFSREEIEKMAPLASEKQKEQLYLMARLAFHNWAGTGEKIIEEGFFVNDFLGERRVVTDLNRIDQVYANGRWREKCQTEEQFLDQMVPNWRWLLSKESGQREIFHGKLRNIWKNSQVVKDYIARLDAGAVRPRNILNEYFKNPELANKIPPKRFWKETGLSPELTAQDLAAERDRAQKFNTWFNQLVLTNLTEEDIKLLNEAQIQGRELTGTQWQGIAARALEKARTLKNLAALKEEDREYYDVIGMTPHVPFKDLRRHPILWGQIEAVLHNSGALPEMIEKHKINTMTFSRGLETRRRLEAGQRLLKDDNFKLIQEQLNILETALQLNEDYEGSLLARDMQKVIHLMGEAQSGIRDVAESLIEVGATLETWANSPMAKNAPELAEPLNNMLNLLDELQPDLPTSYPEQPAENKALNKFLARMEGRVRYDQGSDTLQVEGSLTEKEMKQLRACFEKPEDKAAVEQLYQRSNQFAHFKYLETTTPENFEKIVQEALKKLKIYGGGPGYISQSQIQELAVAHSCPQLSNNALKWITSIGGHYKSGEFDEIQVAGIKSGLNRDIVKVVFSNKQSGRNVTWYFEADRQPFTGYGGLISSTDGFARGYTGDDELTDFEPTLERALVYKLRKHEVNLKTIQGIDLVGNFNELAIKGLAREIRSLGRLDYRNTFDEMQVLAVKANVYLIVLKNSQTGRQVKGFFENQGELSRFIKIDGVVIQPPRKGVEDLTNF